MLPRGRRMMVVLVVVAGRSVLRRIAQRCWTRVTFTFLTFLVENRLLGIFSLHNIEIWMNVLLFSHITWNCMLKHHICNESNWIVCCKLTLWAASRFPWWRRRGFEDLDDELVGCFSWKFLPDHSFSLRWSWSEFWRSIWDFFVVQKSKRLS
jgi:hypothetical protein